MVRVEWAAGLLASDWLSCPDFVAYDWTGGASPQVKFRSFDGCDAGFMDRAQQR